LQKELFYRHVQGRSEREKRLINNVNRDHINPYISKTINPYISKTINPYISKTINPYISKTSVITFNIL